MASFEQQLTALEKVVERLEQGELSLDESVRLFEQGMTLSAACKEELEAAEGKIQLLVERGNEVMVARDLEVEDDDEEIDEDEDEA